MSILSAINVPATESDVTDLDDAFFAGVVATLVADPYDPHPHGPNRRYWASIDRVIGAILLGIVTYDANLLVITPGKED